MNIFEWMVDTVDPGLSIRLRVLKNRWRGDSIAQLIPRLVRPGDVVIDVGANRGIYTWQLSTLVGRSGRVHSVEPYPPNADRLDILARLRSNIVVHRIAVSDRSGQVRLHVPSYRGHLLDALATLNPPSDVRYESVDAPVETMDKLLASEPGSITLVKCDVEGHEDEVLRGSWKLLHRHRPVVIMEIEQRHRAEPVHVMLRKFEQAGYVGRFLGPAGMRPTAEFDVTRHQLGFLSSDFSPYSMPVGYVSDFVFFPSEEAADQAAGLSPAP